jgi:acetyl esterase/lipase
MAAQCGALRTGPSRKRIGFPHTARLENALSAAEKEAGTAMRLYVKPLALAAVLALAACAMAEPGPPPPPARLMTWPDLLGRPRPQPTATIAYGADPLQVADLWLPAGPGRHPVVLMVHGGCWQTEIADRTIMNWIAEDLRRRGIAVWNIDYRGVDRPGGGYPGTFQDVAAAADALRARAAHYRLDLSRLVAIGHSAGGHLALWLAGRPRLPRGSPLRSARPLSIREAISLGGLPDLEEAARSENGCGNAVIGRLTNGGSAAPRPNPYADTSVPRLAPLGLKQVLINGRQDRIIPVAYAEAYAAPMRAAGDDVRVRMLDRTGHVELIAPETAAWAAAVEEIERALRQ